MALEGSIFRFLFLGGFVVIAKEVSRKMIYPIKCYYDVNSVESCKGPVYPSGVKIRDRVRCIGIILQSVNSGYLRSEV